MKVILLCDVKGTGKKDDILTVSDGFARNYLFPRKWAAEATPGAVKEIERKRANEARLEAERRAEAQKTADFLKGKVISLQVKCGEKGRLYGSITNQEIVDALKAQHGTLRVCAAGRQRRNVVLAFHGERSPFKTVVSRRLF